MFYISTENLSISYGALHDRQHVRCSFTRVLIKIMYLVISVTVYSCVNNFASQFKMNNK